MITRIDIGDIVIIDEAISMWYLVTSMDDDNFYLLPADKMLVDLEEKGPIPNDFEPVVVLKNRAQLIVKAPENMTEEERENLRKIIDKNRDWIDGVVKRYEEQGAS